MFFPVTFDSTVKYKMMKKDKVDFGKMIYNLRIKNGFQQKVVADFLGVDISLLSKIEHGERQVQSHMLVGIAALFNLDYKDLQINFLKQKIGGQFGNEPYLKETLKLCLEESNKNS